MMDYNWIKNNLGEVKVRNGRMYIELTEDVYKVLRDHKTKRSEQNGSE